MSSRAASPRIQAVLDWLEAHGIPYEVYFHPPLPTIGEALAYWKDIDATHCKNLFFRNHKGNRHYLVSFECHKDLDIHALEHKLGQGKLSFASPERMERCLGVAPGSVCAFGLIHDIGIAASADPRELFDNGHRVKYFLDADLQKAERISFHPCDNTASVVLGRDMFLRFLSLWGGEYEWLEI
ncbi:MAG: prolyl-tRNA synthetase associated domain-containing protein [Bacteroidales bacterium]|nr:prolyl-tRNA synthetase associated domain-containing protein [Bacteroidales bacterium]